MRQLQRNEYRSPIKPGLQHWKFCKRACRCVGMLEVKRSLFTLAFVPFFCSVGFHLALVVFLFTDQGPPSEAPVISNLKIVQVGSLVDLQSSDSKEVDKVLTDSLDNDNGATSNQEEIGEVSPSNLVLAISSVTEVTTDVFLSSDSVSSPAEPQQEWNLPIERLDQVKVRRISIRIFVMETGQISMIQLLEIDPEVNNVVLMQSIVDFLIQTPMRPALLNGTSVPSTRTIELVFSKE